MCVAPPALRVRRSLHLRPRSLRRRRAVLHAQKLVHTDLKPENILLLEPGYDKEPLETARAVLHLSLLHACLRTHPSIRC